MTLEKKRFENIVGKEENAVHQHYSLSLFFTKEKLHHSSHNGIVDAMNLAKVEILSFGKG